MANQQPLSPIDPANRVSLEVNGMVYEGWKTVRIHHSIEQLAGTFSLDVTELWPDQSEAWAIEPGASCTVKIGGDVMITGYIDSVKVKVSPTEHTITIDGRDKTGDLVDCSPEPKEWVGLTFEQIALEVLSPFGINLVTQLETGASGYIPKKPGKAKEPAKAAGGGGGKLPKKAANSGETVHKLLEKLAKIQGVLLISDRLGGLMVTRAGLNGAATDVLAVGQNLKSIDYDRSFANLFSKITVKGQAVGATIPGQQVLSVVTSVKPTATVVRGGGAGPSATTGSAAVQRYRPLILMAEEQADQARCKTRAEWEASTREAKAKKISVKVQGWRQSDGKLWTINTLARMKSAFVREDQDLLVSTLEYSLDLSGGTVCSMVLQSPKAYDVLKEIPKPTGGGGGGASSPRALSAANATFQQPGRRGR